MNKVEKKEVEKIIKAVIDYVEEDYNIKIENIEDLKPFMDEDFYKTPILTKKGEILTPDFDEIFVAQIIEDINK